VPRRTETTRPSGLEISQAEVDSMGQLGGLVSTPRAAKRVVNIYRLARIGGTAAALKSPVT